MNRLKVVAAHPDDEILEVGGTVGCFAESGLEDYALFSLKDRHLAQTAERIRHCSLFPT